ncbi:MAG: hypothetical protein IKG14_05525 [Clostridia bacterium]|nr:hypothetical protein [Clostridia bacterium]
MIVFYLLLSTVSIIITILLSSIEIDFNKIEIEDINKLKKIYKLIAKKKYEKIFNYMKIEIKIEFLLFSVIPILWLKFDNEKINIITYKLIKYNYKQKRKNLIKYGLKRKKQKIFINKIKNKVLSKVTVHDSNITLKIGLTNAGVTAIAIGILNSLISIFITGYISEIAEKQKISDNQITNIINNFNYELYPVYKDEFTFNLKSQIKLIVPINSLIYKN